MNQTLRLMKKIEKQIVPLEERRMGLQSLLAELEQSYRKCHKYGSEIGVKASEQALVLISTQLSIILDKLKVLNGNYGALQRSLVY